MKKTGILILITILACMMLAGCGAKAAPATGEEPAQITGKENAPAEKEKAKPLYANQIQDGTYKIEVSSSSSMFRIIDARLTVADGEMSAILTLSGDGYEKLYMGTGEEAADDTDDKCIYFIENTEGKYTYTVPVDALNQDTDCAAWSIRKQMWYDRVLVFQSSLLPEEAIQAQK
jgi:major membrane immunogen (membrane-anchored lipoprotein)